MGFEKRIYRGKVIEVVLVMNDLEAGILMEILNNTTTQAENDAANELGIPPEAVMAHSFQFWKGLYKILGDR